ncbi:MAG: DNA mismatch repair endonuclease MutL [Bacillota bacterium]
MSLSNGIQRAKKKNDIKEMKDDRGMTNRIRLLDEATINQIAAGEVVERPASALKELIENSLDAGSTRLDIELEESGLRLIRVTDNGCGMNPEEVRWSIERHATSKIASAQDLLRIVSFGFRGEALSSIAAVSRLELVSRPTDQLEGIRLVTEGGEVQRIEPVGTPIGTRTTIRDIFYNLPVRKKFLKSPATELRYAVDLVSRLVLGNPQVAFRLRVPDRILIQSSGNSRLLEAIAAVYGSEIAQQMLVVGDGENGQNAPATALGAPSLSSQTKSCQQRSESSKVRVWGYVSGPGLTRSNRHQQCFLVNRRYIQSRLLQEAVNEAYRGVIPPQRFPLVVLHLEVDPELIDVNIHPAKLQVRFQEEEAVFQAVVQGLRQALRPASVIPRFDFGKNSFGINSGDKKVEEQYLSNPRQVSMVESLTCSTYDATNNATGVINSERSSIIKNNPTTDSSDNAANSSSNDLINGLTDDSRNNSINNPTRNLTIDSTSNPDTGQYSEQQPGEVAIAEVNLDIYQAENLLVAGEAVQHPKEQQTKLLPVPDEMNDSFANNNKIYKPEKHKYEKLDSVGFAGDQTIKNTLADLLPKAQVAGTYIVAEGPDGLYILDQHALHERILYEKILVDLEEDRHFSQTVLYPETVELTPEERERFTQHIIPLRNLGFVVEHFGGNTFLLRGIPAFIKGSGKEVFLDLLDYLVDRPRLDERRLYEEMAARLACHQAIKAEERLNQAEMETLVLHMASLSSPYACPHGRPTILKLSWTELGRRFHRR